MRKWLCSAAAVCVLTASLAAEDWPGWRGPDRTDVSKETGLLQKWPSGGPKLLWTFDQAGIGYSGFSVVDGKLYTMAAYDKDEYVICLDAATGKKVWGAKVGKLYTNGWGDGPRATPTVDGKAVYAISGQGNIVCLAAATGKPIWSKTMKQFGGKTPGWGYTESPLVDGPLVIVTPGGKQGAVVALNKKTGTKVWQSKQFTDGAQYASAIVAVHNGVRQYIQLTMKSVVGLEAKTGKLLWKSDWPGKTAVIPTPIYHDGHVFVTSGYGVGCKLIKIGDNNPQDVYFNKDLQNHHGGVILYDGHLYGHSNMGGWTCKDFLTGKTRWQHRAFKKGAIAFAGGRFICIEENGGGRVALIEPSPDGWKEHGSFRLPKETELRKPKGRVWTHPTVSNGRLYLRDQNLIFCFDVKAR